MSLTLSVTLRLTLRVTLNLTARESILHIDPAFSDGPRSISLAWGKHVEKLIAGPSRQTQGMRSKLWFDFTVAAPLVAASGWMIRVYDQRRAGVLWSLLPLWRCTATPACTVGSLARV